MERVAFLLEETGESLPCLLNPNTLVMRRAAGVSARRSAAGKLTGAGMRDDPLMFTGGGTTELNLDLLFDVTLSGSTIETDDVRDLTRPLWALAENNGRDERGYGRPPVVRLVWGKSWNEPGVITAVAERLERFEPTGSPQRSWMRMRMLRVGEAAEEEPAESLPAESFAPSETMLAAESLPEDVRYHMTVGGGPEGTEAAGERLDQIAQRYYGDPSMWRLIASFNNLDDPTSVPAGTLLLIPPLGAAGQSA